MFIRFIILKFINITLNFILKFNFKLFLLYINFKDDIIIFFKIFFYINDIFGGVKIFNKMYKFLLYYFFFKIKFINLYLKFSLLKLFIIKIKVFNIIYLFNKRVKVLLN